MSTALDDSKRRPTSARQLPVLLLREKEAAEALAIGIRALWELTHDGQIPVVYIGKSKRYRLSDLQEWVAARPTGKPPPPSAT